MLVGVAAVGEYERGLPCMIARIGRGMYCRTAPREWRRWPIYEPLADRLQVVTTSRVRASTVRYRYNVNSTEIKHGQRWHGSHHIVECSRDDVRELSGAADVEDERSETIRLRAGGFPTSSGPRETRQRYEARNPPVFVSTTYSIARRASTNDEINRAREQSDEPHSRVCATLGYSRVTPVLRQRSRVVGVLVSIEMQ